MGVHAEAQAGLLCFLRRHSSRGVCDPCKAQRYTRDQDRAWWVYHKEILGNLDVGYKVSWISMRPWPRPLPLTETSRWLANFYCRSVSPWHLGCGWAKRGPWCMWPVAAQISSSNCSPSSTRTRVGVSSHRELVGRMLTWYSPKKRSPLGRGRLWNQCRLRLAHWWSALQP